jgi:hypothetical protein
MSPVFAEIELSPGDESADVIIHDVVDILASSYCENKMAFLVVRYPNGDVAKYSMLKTCDLFHAWIVENFKMELRRVNPNREVFVNKFYLSTEDMLKTML